MSVQTLRYKETLPEEFSIKHKISELTEKKTFHLHRQFEIIFALSDNLVCRFEDGIEQIPKHGILLLDQMSLHYIYNGNAPSLCDRYVLYFSSNYIVNLSTPEVNLMECFLLCQKQKKHVLTVPHSCCVDFLSLLKHMDEFHNNAAPTALSSFGWSLHTKFLLGQFLVMTNRLYLEQFGAAPTAIHSMHSEIVYRIYDFIEANYKSRLNTENIAKYFGVSKTQLYYIFKEVSGTTVSEYIADYRITKAKDLLINSTYSVEYISQDIGYGNLSSFSRSFKAKTGKAPLQYRKEYQL